ncbi:MAG: hypothetical protein JWM00_326 [Candidatus Saccharibacteria bacterium]|nr:hypothetical protein [Candidatus Saccharibacteria bacterium]
MKHLVVAVSPDSSLELLAHHADIVVLDKGLIKDGTTSYDTIYIRSHFSQQSTLPQNFRSEIDSLVQQARDRNPNVKFIDGMDNVDTILAFEDKWLQYKTFDTFMSRTELYDDNLDTSSFARPVYKNRLSSRGSGVTWDRERVIKSPGDWVVQESLDIQEELRVYVILGEVYPIGAVKQSMTEGNIAQGINSRPLTQDEVEFSLSLMEQAPSLDIVGIDIARITDGGLSLMEINRSPGFAKFYELTGFNLADKLYKTLDAE